MSVFDNLVSRVWAEARENDGALLKDFAALPSDRARAARVLEMELPILDGELKSQSLNKDVVRASMALQKAAGASNAMEALQALNEALRFAPECEAVLMRSIMDKRSNTLLSLQEPASCLLGLRNQQEQLPDPDDDVGMRLRVGVVTCRCLALQGEWARAEAAVREALEAVRASPSMDVHTKSRHIGELMEALRTLKQRQGTQDQASTPPLPVDCRARSGLQHLPKLLGGPHASIPCAAAAVELHVDKRRGRHLVASRNIPIGGVLVVEPACAWSLAPEYLSSHCLHCCAPTLAPLPCYTCTEVVFCCGACRASGQEYHAAECGLLGLLQRGGGRGRGELSAMAHLVYRIVVRAAGLSKQLAATPSPPATATLLLDPAFQRLHAEPEQDGPAAGQGQGKEGPGFRTEVKLGARGSEYSALLGQLTHSDVRPAADLLKRSLTAAFLTCCLRARARFRGFDITPPDQLTLTAAFLRHLQACSCNAYQVSEQGLPGGSVRGVQALELGGACYPTVSLINHACCPNVARHSHGNVCVVRASRSIPKGGELLDCYGPHYLESDKEDRREDLEKQYFFQCECHACREDWPQLRQLPAAPVLRCSGCGNSLGREVVASKRCPKCGKKRCVPDLSQPQARFDAGVQSLLRGDVEEALQAALEYSAWLERAHKSPSREQARALQVLSLCWSLSGNTRWT